MPSDNEMPAEEATPPPTHGSADNQDTHCDKCHNKLGTGWQVQCSVCDGWSHRKCTELNIEDVKYLDKVKKRDGEHSWACFKCSRSLKAMRDTIIKLERRIEKVEGSCDKVTKDVDALNDKVVTMDKDLDQVCNDLDKLKSQNPVAQSNIDMMNELREQAIRRDNVLIHNAPESGIDLSNKAKKDHDMKIIADICSELKIDFNWEDDVKFISRVGKLSDDGYPRPIICGFRDRALRDRLLNLQFKLKHSRNLSNYRMVPDLTKNERDSEIALENECTRRNKEITDNDPEATFLWTLLGQKGAKRMVQRETADTSRKRSRPVGGGTDGGSSPEQQRPTHRQRMDYPPLPNPQRSDQSNGERRYSNRRQNPTPNNGRNYISFSRPPPPNRGDQQTDSTNSRRGRNNR